MSMDYDNSLLGGILCANTQRLQRHQHRAAGLIYCVNKRTSVSPITWASLVASPAVNQLQDLHKPGRNPGRNGLRSAHDTLRLDVPITKRIVGDSVFPVIGAKLWMGVPLHIHQAKIKDTSFSKRLFLDFRLCVLFALFSIMWFYGSLLPCFIYYHRCSFNVILIIL